MALNPVAFITPGCSAQCPGNVVGKSNSFAYAGAQSIAYYRVETKNVPNTTAAGGDPAQAQAQQQQYPVKPPVTVASFPLDTVFGHGVTAKITAFDYNDEYMACLTPQTMAVHLWKLSDAEPLTAKKIPSSLAAMLKKDGSPSTMCLAGRYHLIFGTQTGRLISLNTNEGHEPRSVVIPDPSHLSAGGANAPSVNEGVEGVECIAVAPSRADTVACGTSDGTLCLLNLSATTGLRATAALRPFPPSTAVAATALGVSASQLDNAIGQTQSPAVSSAALPITTIAFDPNALQFLVVGSVEGALALFDFSANAVVQSYEWTLKRTKDSASPAAVSAVAWIPGEHGAFFTCSVDSNKIEKWSATPANATTGNPAASRTAISAFCPVPAEAGGIRCISCLDKERIVLSLTSGVVIVYNVPRRCVEFETDGGHTDATLACCYSKHDRDLVATCGVDGYVRVWNMRCMMQQYTIDAGQVMVYSVDWSPNGKQLVAGLGTGEVVAYSCATKHELWRTSVCSDVVYRVCWSASDSNVIVATSRTGLTLLAKDGKVMRRYNSTHGAMLSCDVESTKGKLIAVGCQDHKVCVFNVSSNSDSPLLVLSGHTDSVGDVAFNPTAPHFLLSCSHDGTVRVWDLSSNDAHTISVSARLLKGHTDRVRSVAWCSLAPYLALSGSSDATIRVWDIRNGVMVTSVRSHNADVRGIASHPDRPLVFASVAQDSTIAFWHLSLLRQVYLDAALGTLEQCVVADTTSLMAVASSGVSVSVVAGAGVAKLLKQLREATKQHERMSKIVSFFEFPCGAMDVADAATYAVEPQSFTADGKRNTKQVALPLSKLIDTRAACAKHLAERARGRTVAAAGPACVKMKLIEAADAMLLVGKLEECITLLLEAEEWDRAVAMAPLLSREYWRAVCLRAGEAMEASGDTQSAVRYYILAEESARAARALARGSSTAFDTAAVVCQTCPQRSAEATGAAAPQEPPHQTTIDTNGVTACAQEMQLARATTELAKYNNPRLFSAAYIANGGVHNDEAVRVLHRSGDAVLAHLLVHTVPLREQSSIDSAYRMAMLQSARQHKWDTAVICAGRQSDLYDSYATLVALFQHAQAKQLKAIPAHSLTSQNMNSFHNINDKLKNFYESIRQACQQQDVQLDANIIQQRHAADGLASQCQLAAMALSADAQAGPVTTGQVLQSITGFVESLLNVVLQDADGVNAAFYLKQAYNVTAYVSLPLNFANSNSNNGNSTSALAQLNPASQSATTAQSMSPEHRKFLSCAFAIAALMCVKVYRFPKLLNPAFAKARELAQGDAASEQLIARVQAVLGSYSPSSIEVDCAVVGHCVPATAGDGRQVMSALSGEPVRGARHLLEDGTSAITKGEAVAWTLCCHFSPLASGVRMLIL